MAQNSWQLGTMYYGGTFNGIRNFYTQPGGPFTQVFPASQQSQPFENYPIKGLVFTLSPWFIPGCQHLTKLWTIIQDYDYTQDTAVQLITCEQCSYIQRAVPVDANASVNITPAGGAGVLNPYQYPIIVG